MPTTFISPSVAESKAHNVILTNRLIAGYAKVTPGRADSAARQRASLEAYCLATFGRPLDAFYEDRGRRDASTNGEMMGAMLDLAAEGEIGVIIIEDLTRLSRRQEKIRDFVSRFRDMGVWIHTSHSGVIQLEPDAPGGVENETPATAA